MTLSDINATIAKRMGECGHRYLGDLKSEYCEICRNWKWEIEEEEWPCQEIVYTSNYEALSAAEREVYGENFGLGISFGPRHRRIGIEVAGVEVELEWEGRDGQREELYGPCANGETEPHARAKCLARVIEAESK